MRLLLALLMLMTTMTAATEAVPAAPSPSPPPGGILLPAAQPQPGQMGYYMMQGSRIVSQPYSSGPACMKALAALMKSIPSNTAPIVCAHRAP